MLKANIKPRICVRCGIEYTPTGRRQLYCQKCIKGNREPNHKKSKSLLADLEHARKFDKARMTDAAMRRDALRRRDEAYAAWERENGVADAVSVRGGVLTVRRGTIPAGFRSTTVKVSL